MTDRTYEAAPTRYVEARGVRFAGRRVGRAGGAPTVLNQHFHGPLDCWDPAQAQLMFYPGSNHGSFYQHPERFVAETALFLGA